jgi:hypothetical protein
MHWSYFFPSVHNLIRYSEMFRSFVHFLSCKEESWLQSRIQALGFTVCIFFLAREIGHGQRDSSFRFSTSLHFEVCAAFWPSPVHFACVAGFACLLLWAFVLTPLLFL